MGKSERHTNIGRVINELYPSSNEDTPPVLETELHEVEHDPNHASFEDIVKIPQYIPDDMKQIPGEFLEHQLLRNLIQSYRIEFATHGNGNPTGYGYDILESDHVMDKGDDVFKLVVLYKNKHEQGLVRRYVDGITALAKRRKWFHGMVDFIYQKRLPSDNEFHYFLFDKYSMDNLHHPRVQYDPYDDSLNELIGNPFYKIVGFDEWRAEMLQEAYTFKRKMNYTMKYDLDPGNALTRWLLNRRVKYTMKSIIGCVSKHDEIEVTW